MANSRDMRSLWESYDLPPGVLKAQKQWERAIKVYRAIEGGAKYKEVAKAFGVTADTIRGFYGKGWVLMGSGRGRLVNDQSPAEKFIEESGRVEMHARDLLRCFKDRADDRGDGRDWLSVSATKPKRPTQVA